MDGHDHVLLDDLQGDQADDVGVDLELVEVDVGIAQLPAQGLGHVLLGDQAERNDGRLEGNVLFLLGLEGRLQLVGREDFFTKEKFAEV